MKIRSTKELVYNSRDAETAIIQLEIQSWNYNVFKGNYNVNIADSHISTVTGTTTNELGEEVPFEREVETQMNSIVKEYSTAEINGLFQLLGSPISLEVDYTEQMNELIQNALLIVTQQQPIYGSEPQDWEIYNEPV